MMAQTITPERKTVALGEEFKVSYTDAPADALLVVWKTGTNKNEPTVQTTISAGSGEASLAIPSDATLDPYWIQMVTNGDEGFVDLSNRATIATNYTNEDMLLIVKHVYEAGEPVQIYYEKAPAYPGDWFGVYTPNAKVGTDLSVTWAYITGESGNATLGISSGYFRVWYLFKDAYETVYEPVDIAVGKKASLSMEETFTSPAKDLKFTYSGAKPFGKNDHLAIYKKGAWLEEDAPVWVSDTLSTEGEVIIPAGTLNDGMYTAYVMFQDTKEAFSVGVDFTITVVAEQPPVLAMDATKINLGEPASIKYTDAPEGARMCIFSRTSDYTAPVAVLMNITPGEGEANFTLPQTLPNSTYYAQMYLVSGRDSILISNKVEFKAWNVAGDFTMKVPNTLYQTGEGIEIEYENAPACEGDWFATYPQGYDPATPKGDENWRQSSTWTRVNSADDVLTLNAPNTSGYYSIWYLLEDGYETIAEPVNIIVGKPAKNTPSQQQYTLNQDVIINFSDLSDSGSDIISIFNGNADITTDEPVYTFTPEGEKEGKFTIEAGTLKSGTYKVVCFYAGTRTPLSEPTELKVANAHDLLILEAQRAIDSTYYYVADIENPLITNADDADPENCQISSNAMDPADAAYINLIDENPDTYFYSMWSVTGPDAPHHLLVDLKDNPVQSLQFKFTQASWSWWGQVESWKDVIIYASNDNETWNEIVELKDLPTQSQYYSPTINLMDTYRYVRFDVMRTPLNAKNNGQVRFLIGDFQLYQANADIENSQCTYDPDLKAACEKLTALMEQAKNEVETGTESEETAEALKAAINEVRALTAHPELLEQAVSDLQKYLSTYTAGDDYGQVDIETYTELESVFLAVSDYDPLRLTVKEISERVNNATTAIEEFSKHIKTFETNKWYYITNTDKRRSGEGSIYNTKVFGNAIYPLSSNLEDENFVGNEDGLTFGYYDAEEEILTNQEDPYLMWRIVPVDEEAKTYAFQNRATGTYMGALFNHEAGYHGMSLEPVPYRINILGAGQFEMVCQDEKNDMQEPVHASGDGVLKAWSDGGYDGSSSWTFAPVSEELDAISIKVETNSVKAVCLPYAVSDLDVLNDDVQTYVVKNLVDGTTLELTKKSSFEAGEPFIIVCGDPTAYDPENAQVIDLYTYLPEETVIGVKAGNGLVSTMPYKTVIAKSGFGYFAGNGFKATTAEPVSIDAQSAYLDASLVQDAGTAVDLTLTLSEGQIDGVKTAINNAQKANQNIYTIDGKLVGKAQGTTKNLQKGLYIIGKKKVTVK